MANAFPFADPVAISRNTANSLGVEMADLRRGLSGLVQPMYGSTSGAMSGILPDGTSGAGYSNGLLGFVQSGLTLSFNAGNYVLDRGAGNTYLGMAYSGFNITLEQGDAVNPRIDMVVIRHRDPGLTGEATATQSAWPEVLKGVPAANPSKPTNQLTSTDVPLGSWTVGGGANRNAIIASADERLQIVSRGGIYQAASHDTRPGAYEGQYRDNLANNNLERWSGSAWQPVAAPAPWTVFTPRIMCDGTGTDINIGGAGAKKIARYQVLGKTLRFQYFFQWGAQPWNGGYGNIFTLLPSGMVAATSDFSWWNVAHLWLNTSTGYVADIGGWSWLRGGTNKIYPSFPIEPTTLNNGFYRIAQNAGAANTGVPKINGFPEGGELAISGTIEVQ